MKYLQSQATLMENIDLSPKDTKDKLTDWKNPPAVTDLKADLNAADEYHKTQTSKISNWLDALHLRGRYAPLKVPNKSTIAPKLIRKQNEWRYSALTEVLLSSSDLYSISPTSWEDTKSAYQNELVINKQFDTQLDKVRFVDTLVRALVDEGTAILRTGWNTVEEEVTEEVPKFMQIVDPSYLEELQGLMQELQEKPELEAELTEAEKMSIQLSQEAQQPIRVYQDGTETQTTMKVIRNHPTVDVCHFDDVYVDPTCNGDLSKASFIVYKFETSMSDLKRAGIYTNLESINVQNATTPTDNASEYQRTSTASNFKFKDEARQKLFCYEYWGYYDINSDGIARPIVCTWVGDTIIRMEENPYPDKKFPFVFIPFMPVKDSLYGEPDAELLIDNQRIQGAVLRAVIDLVAKNSAGQTGFAKGALDTSNFNKFRNGEDFEFNPTAGDIRNTVFTQNFPNIPETVPFLMNLVNTDAESLTGVRAFSQSGVSGVNMGQTAEAVRGALDAASKREMGIVRRLGNGLVEVARKFLAMNAVFLEEEEVVRVSNEKFIPIKRDDLRGEFDLRINLSTPEEDSQKAQVLSMMTQTIGNTLDQSFTKMLLAKIARLYKIPDLAYAVENFNPQPDPMQQAMQEAELQRAQAEAKLLMAQAMEAEAKAQLNSAKINVEGARAANMQSTTDKNNLDFYKDAEGIKHEETLEQSRQQAQADLQKEQMKQDSLFSQNLLKNQTDLTKEQIKANLQKTQRSDSE